MIILTKLNGKEIMLNENMIENVSETPDTVITMAGGHTYIVQENIEEIFQKTVAFQRYCKQRSREGKES